MGIQKAWKLERRQEFVMRVVRKKMIIAVYVMNEMTVRKIKVMKKKVMMALTIMRVLEYLCG
jgi:hypothetical protein